MGRGSPRVALFYCSVQRSDDRASQLSTQSEVYLWFRGRKKEVIVRGGSNISPQEAEAVLYQHTAVREAGVNGPAGRDLGVSE
jgi:acyl-CoA synthetase (AMP-forming)/AMP-acid ligase II